MLLDTCIAEKRIDRIRCSFEIKSTSLPTVDVGKTDTLKLSFTVIDDENNNEGVQPHQAFLRFWSDSGEEGTQPVKVSSSGKAKFELVSEHVDVRSCYSSAFHIEIRMLVDRLLASLRHLKTPFSPWTLFLAPSPVLPPPFLC